MTAISPTAYSRACEQVSSLIEDFTRVEDKYTSLMRRCGQVVADPDSRYTLVNLIGALHCLQMHVRMTQLDLDSISQRVDRALAILEDAATEGE